MSQFWKMAKARPELRASLMLFELGADQVIRPTPLVPMTEKGAGRKFVSVAEGNGFREIPVFSVDRLTFQDDHFQRV